MCIQYLGQRGRSHYLLGKSNIQKDKPNKPIEEDKENVAKIDELKMEINLLKSDLEKKEKESKEKEDYHADILNNLFNKGIIDDKGNVVGSDDND
jgi:hypothetical protein